MSELYERQPSAPPGYAIEVKAFQPGPFPEGLNEQLVRWRKEELRCSICRALQRLYTELQATYSEDMGIDALNAYTAVIYPLVRTQRAHREVAHPEWKDHMSTFLEERP